MDDEEHVDGDEDIVGPRVSLVVVPASVLERVVVAVDGAGSSAGVPVDRGSPEDVAWDEVGGIPGELFGSMPARRRLEQLASDPGLARWLVRAIVVDDADAPAGRRMVGHLGGHGAPDDAGRVEIGYTVLASERGKGIATEAARAWFDWAHRNGGRTARLSTVPDNGPSRAVARKLGLAEVGGEWDEDDACWELVHEGPLPLAPSPGG